MKANGFDSILMATIQLKLKSKGSLDEVISLITQLENDLTTQQDSADEDYQDKNVIWTNLLDEVNQMITQYEDSIDEYTQKIITLKAELNDLNSQLTEFQNQQETFTTKRERLVEARENDLSAYNKRNSDQTAMLNALEKIVELLESKSTTTNLAEIQEKYGSNLKKFKEIAGPYAALVGLTLSFDPTVIQDIISRLNSLAAAIRASIAEDSDIEEKAKVDYQGFLDSIDEALQSIAENIATTQRKITDDTFELNSSETELENAETMLESLKSQKSDIEKERDVYNATYEKETQQRFYF